MKYCNSCNNLYANCHCISPVISSQTVINSEAAGRDGESAYNIAKRLGKIPSTMTEGEYIDSLKGADGEAAENLAPQSADEIFG